MASAAVMWFGCVARILQTEMPKQQPAIAGAYNGRGGPPEPPGAAPPTSTASSCVLCIFMKDLDVATAAVMWFGCVVRLLQTEMPLQ